MAMEEKKGPSTFLVLGDIVQDFSYVDPTAFQLVKCRRQEAYGCGQNGDAIVRGLALYVRLGPVDDQDRNPELCISASNLVLERIRSEIEESKARIHGRNLLIAGDIYTVDGDVMVLRVSFIDNSIPSDFRTYYLVYDSAAQSMTLLSCLPCYCRPLCTTVPLKLNFTTTVGEEEQGRYSLVLMSTDVLQNIPVVCLWSPHKRRDYSRCPWDVKPVQPTPDNAAAMMIDAKPPFRAHAVFVFKGYAVWADLGQGVLYCGCNHLIDDGPVGGFKHIMLPRECMYANILDPDPHLFISVYRNMGCVGDSIWFVNIQPNRTCPRDTVVKVWTLDLLSLSDKEEDKCWNLHREFKMLELFKAAQGLGLPETTVPKFPILMQQQQGAFYMFLPVPFNTGDGLGYGHLLCIDLSSSCEVRLLSNTRLAIPMMDRPVALDPNFLHATSSFQC